MSAAAWDLAERARIVHGESIVWDAHACLPLIPGHSMEALERHRAAGVSFVSVNVGMDMNPMAQIMRIIAGFRAWLEQHSDHFLLAGSVADVERAKREGKLAVAFDLEGSVMLADDPAMVRLYRDLGVRQIHLAYNRDNSVAGGCHGNDVPLTPLGRRVVEAINRAGLIIDCSHSGYRTSMEIMERSTRPVIFSHSNPRALKNHARNMFGELSGDLPPGSRSEEWWPPGNEYDVGDMKIMPPERFPAITEGLLARGYAESDVRRVLGGNMCRVAGASWL